jgi:putative aldouronate transport system permease protein
MGGRHMVRSAEGRIFNSLVIVILFLVGFASIAPLLYVVSVSLTPYTEVLRNGGYVIIPKQLTFSAYQAIFRTPYMVNSMGVSVFITTVGTALNITLTLLMAYPLSRKNLPLRGLFMTMVVITLLFSGGIIPTYLIVKSTGLLNSIWALIIPSAISSFNLLIMKSFFERVPEELLESARMDGARELRILLQMLIPLSIPVLVTIGLFYGVAHWNQFFSAIMYITDRNLFPLQVIIKELLMLSQQTQENTEEVIPTVTLQMSAIIFATLPIAVVYPFLQKHFTQGMLLGSLKG